jgi:hypothetical protein
MPCAGLVLISGVGGCKVGGVGVVLVLKEVAQRDMDPAGYGAGAGAG